MKSRASSARCPSQWTHRRKTSAASLRTRTVSASDRRTLFDSPVPAGSSIVLNVRPAFRHAITSRGVWQSGAPPTI